MTDDPIDWAALDRYIAGEGTPEERELMRRRIRASPVLTSIVDVMRSAHGSTAPQSEASDADAAWRSLSARLGSNATQSPRRPAALTLIPADRQSGNRLARVTGWAAAILVIAGGGYASWKELRHAPASRETAPAIRATYATARGERATVELRDGTQVTLAPETEMRVAATGRQVYLRGEAAFTVTHNPAEPFRVVAPSGTTVQDIGTHFDFRAYDKTVRIVVADGSVSIQGTQPLVLTRGTLAVVDSTGVTRVTPNVTAERYLAWSQGQLTFENAPMREVLPELQRWYDMDVRLGSAKLADARLTVTLSDIPGNVAVDVIARALDATAVRAGQTVTLVSRR